MYFSLKTGEEFRNTMINFQVPTLKKEKNVQKRLAGDVPNFINWKKRGYVTTVRKQVYYCFTCLSSSTTEEVRK